MQAEERRQVARRPRPKRAPGEWSRDAKAGQLGLNLHLSVTLKELREKALESGMSNITILFQNIALGEWREDILDMPKGEIPIHLRIRRKAWVQWMRKVPEGITPRDAMGRALSLWTLMQKEVKDEDGWIDPWSEVEDLDGIEPEEAGT